MSLFLVLLLLLVTGATIWLDVSRSRALTPLTLLSLSNLGYVGINPIVWVIDRSKARYFEFMVDMGSVATAAGIGRTLLAATCFQAACLLVVYVRPIARLGNARLSMSDSMADALFRSGVFINAVGLVGIVLVGLRYDGSVFGLYHLAYGQRTEYLYGLGALWFMTELPYYGVSILVVAGAGSSRYAKVGLGALIALVIHGFALKAKLPVLYAACAYTMANSLLARGGLKLRHLAPLSLVAVLLLSIGQARHAQQQDIAGMVQYLAEHEGEWEDRLGRPWENDLPGPAALSYLIVNDDNEGLSDEPLRETVMVFVPRFVFDRGSSQSDRYAQKLLRNEYFVGAGLAWSLVCDGYRMLGFVGVFVVGLLAAYIAHSANWRARSPDSRYREYWIVLMCVSTPIFLVAARAGVSSLLKTTVIVGTLTVVPLSIAMRFAVSPRARSGAGNAERSSVG